MTDFPDPMPGRFDAPIYKIGDSVTEHYWTDEHGDHERRWLGDVLIYSSDWPWWKRLWRRLFED